MGKLIEHLEDLKPDPKNANRGTPRGHGIIEQSIRRHGAGRSGLAANDGTMIAGSQTLEEMAALGMKIKPVHTRGDEWVVVIRDDIEPGSEQAALMGLEDNQSTLKGVDWNPAVLAELGETVDLSGLFNPDEMAALLAAGEPEIVAGNGGDNFDATPQDGPTRTHLGDLWQIGPHRLIVGDCTDPAVVERLMGGERALLFWSDPPYNVDAAGSTRDPRDERNYGKGRRIENDDMSDDDFIVFLRSAFYTADLMLCDGGVFYVAHPDRYSLEFRAVLRDQGWHCPQTIIWIKDNFVFGRNDYHPQHEQILYGWKRGAAHHAVSDRTQSTVWEIPVGGRHEDHPTEKPLELVERALRNSSNRGDLVTDWFLGGGTTIIAGHRTGRKVYGCEISLRYADVILRRAEAEGLTCERAGE